MAYATLLAVAAACGRSAAADAAAPLPTLLEPEVYLARAPAASGGGLAGTLSLVNASAGTLTVDNVRTDCGCTVADWPREPVAAGDTLRIPVRLSCRRSGLAEHEVAIWIRGLRRPLRALVRADCP